jgi:microcystin-dependent protein
MAIPGSVVNVGKLVTPGGAAGPQGLNGLDGSPIGVVIPYTVITPPNGWLLADGRAVLRNSYIDLFNLIGTTYGAGDGSTTFNLPDCRSKFILGAGQDPGPPALANRVLAAEGGEEAHALSIAELASHTHTMGNHTHSMQNHTHGMDHLHDLQSHTHLGVDHLHGVTGVNHLHGLGGHTHSYVHPATTGPTWSGSGWTDANASTGGPTTASDAADRSLATSTGAMDRGATTGGPGPNNTGYASSWSASWANTGGPSAAATAGPSTNTSDAIGSGTAHNNMPPFIVLVYIIKYGIGDYVNGVPGPPGTAATINVGTTTTGAPGTSALVSNSGGTTAAVFNFTIPRGDVGATGQPAWTLTTTSPFTIPAFGASGVVNVTDSSWIAIGEWVYVDDANSTGSAGQLIVTGKTPTTVTLMNPVPATVTGIPLADATQNGLLRQVSGNVTDYVGGDNACHPLPSLVSFVTKTGAYTLTAADSNKYIICSNGFWTLTLPAPVAGMTYRLRNDQGISGVTGTITLQPTGGTIDGQATLALLPQQECTLFTDGTNWRTFELKREVILGSLTVANVASFSLLLPVGYSEFELSFSQFYSSASMPNMQGQVSQDGGNTWLTTANYWGTYMYPSSTTALATSSYANLTAWYVTHYIENANPRHFLRMHLLPGDSSLQMPEFTATSTMYQMTAGYCAQFVLGGWFNVYGRINALQFLLSAGNFTKMTVRVKGIV